MGRECRIVFPMSDIEKTCSTIAGRHDFAEHFCTKKCGQRRWKIYFLNIFHYTNESAATVAETEMYGAGAVSGWRALATELDSEWRIPDFVEPYDAWGYYVWDATVHTARALAAVNSSCFALGSCTQDAIRSQDSYIGATGRVKLDENGDRAVGRYGDFDFDCFC